MRKLCPIVLILALLTAGCRATDKKHAAAGTTQQAPSTAASSTPPPEVPSEPATSTPPPATSSTSEAPPANTTERVTVRPVTSAGDPAAGFSVTNEDQDSFTCTGETSPVAVSPNIRFCGYSATDTVACWKSSVPATVLCLRNPLTKKLVRIKYTGAFAPTAAPAHPAPQALVLNDDDQCQIRDGGAWATVPSQPTWVGWYYCASGKNIYGPMSGNGIDETSLTWAVHAVAPSGIGPITTHSVTTAYYVGTA
jgi:hypothetical protein